MHELRTIAVSRHLPNEKNPVYLLKNVLLIPVNVYIVNGGNLIHRVIWPKQGTSTKLRSAEIFFNKNTPVSDSQESLLSGLANKKRKINQVIEKLKYAGIQALSTIDDADPVIPTCYQ